jgi:YD repeat-containing protein
VSNSTVNLGGTFTLEQLGVLERSAATVNLTGTLNNVGTGLVLDSTTGPFRIMDGSRIVGGTVTGAGGVGLVMPNAGFFSGGAWLDGVVLEADMAIGVGGKVTVTNGLVLNGVVTINGAVGGNNTSAIFFADDNFTLAGTGQIVLVDSGFYEPAQTGLRANSGTLTIGPGITIRGGDGTVGTASLPLVVQGRILADTAGRSIWVAGTSVSNLGVLAGHNLGVLVVNNLTNDGTIQASAGGVVDINSPLAIHGQSMLVSQPPGVVRVAEHLHGNVTSPLRFTPEGNTTFDGVGTAGSPQLLEIMSHDMGTNTAGFSQNFVYGTLELAKNTYVRLVDQSDNSPGTNAEALYVNFLIVPAGCTLDLNGFNVYMRAAAVAGSLLNGSFAQVPDSGPLTLGTATPGAIALVGELDEWTWFGRAGEVITVVVDAGSDSVPAPRLEWVEVQVLHSVGGVLASNVNTAGGRALVLPDITVPSDGLCRVQVRAHPSYPSSMGNYAVTVWNVTPDELNLVLNQQVLGRIETPYSVDRWNFSAVANTQVRLELVSVSRPGVEFRLNGPGGWIGFSNLTTGSGLVTLPTSGSYSLTAYGTGGQYGVDYAFLLLETVQTPLALGEPFVGQFVGSGQAHIFRITVPASSPMRVVLSTAGGNNHTELYAHFGAPPTRGIFDFASNSGSSPNQSITVPQAYAGDYYVLVYGDIIGTPGSFTIEVTTSGMFLTSVTPSHHGASTDAQLTLLGAGFDPTSTVALVDTNDIPYSGNLMSVDSFTQMTVTVPSNSVPPGLYTVRASQPDGDLAELANAFEVQPGAEARLETRLTVPAQVGYHTLATIYVEFENSGNAAMPAPLLEVGGTQNGQSGAWLTLTEHRLVEGFWTSATPEGFAHSVQFLASGATPGLLQPGESGRVPVYYAGWKKPWDLSYPPIYFNLGILDANNTNFVDWVALKDTMRPDSLKVEQWEPVFWNLVAQTGPTWGDYVKMLNDNARYLHRLDIRVTDIRELLGFETMQASGLSVTRTLASAVDAQVQTPGLPLTFTRSFSTDIASHFTLGRLGRGWSDNWDRSLAKAADGTVTIFGPGGSRRVFKPDSRYAGRYFAPAGDAATLAPAAGGAYTLCESDGTLYAFQADGKLDYLADTHGNSVACTYSGGLLTRLTHSAGPYLDLAYSGNRVAAVTDSLGRTTIFGYQGEHLATATDFRGQTTVYAYLSGQGAAREHALSYVRNADGTESHYAYDGQGRLVMKSGCCGSTECTYYSYDSAGRVTATDALTNSTHYFFDHRGLLVRTENPLGGIVHRTFDLNGRLMKTTDAAGRSRTFTCDPRGNLSSETDALGYPTRYTYTTDLNRLASVLDAKGNLTRYAYHPDGALASITYPDGSHENWSYDSQGNRVSWINRRRQTIWYTNDVLGRVIARAYPDGVVHTFDYDAQGNLAGYTDPLGATTQEFDADGRLAKITYPGNRWLGYTYDAAGRRALMTNELGYETRYFYDSAGRLERLADERGSNIVVYAYDPAGRMALKTLGNGVYTTYGFSSTQGVFPSARASYWESYCVAKSTCGRQRLSRSMGLKKGAKV